MTQDLSREKPLSTDMARSKYEGTWTKARRVLSKAAHTRTGKAVIGTTAAVGLIGLSQTPPGQDAMRLAGDYLNPNPGQTTPVETAEPTQTPEFSRDQMVNAILNDLKDEPRTRSYFNEGGNITINFGEGSHFSTVPYLRTSLEADDSNPDLRDNRFSDLENVVSVNGLPVDGINKGLTLTIDNFTYVVKDDIINNSREKWIALYLSLKDGSSKTVYLNEQRASGLVNESVDGHAQELSLATPQEAKKINLTAVVPQNQ